MKREKLLKKGYNHLNKTTNKICALFLVLLIFSCAPKTVDSKELKQQINTILDTWHKDVSNVDYNKYFSTLSNDAIFIGTDASENWTKLEFQKFAKPHFDKKKTWDFKPLERNIYFSKDNNTAWFDELLDTWMGVSRGSGVLEKENNTWKIKHYVLSTTIPNDEMKKIAKIKKEKDSLVIGSFKK
jgi:hypothetical protein